MNDIPRQLLEQAFVTSAKARELGDKALKSYGQAFNSTIGRILFKSRGVSSVEYIRLKIRELTSPAFTRRI